LSAACLTSSISIADAATRIHPGDKVALTVFNHPDLSGELTVTSEGEIRVPVAGTVSIEGLSEAGAAERVQTALSAYLFHPSADVHVVSQGQSIFFTGSLVGTEPIAPGETLSSAIAAFRQIVKQGNGIQTPGINNVDLRKVRIARGRHVFPPVDLEALERTGDAGLRLEPGDVVMLKSKPIRVDVRGAISAPTAVYVNPGDTLAQAVAEVGPLSPSTSLISIGLRRDGADSVVSSAGAEFKGPAHDGDIVTLQPAPRVSVLGMVEKGGDAVLQARPSLLNALYEAGGPNRYADLAHVRITHEGQTQTVNISGLTHGDLSQNPPVADGDVIFVPEGHKIDLGALSTAMTALGSISLLKGL
jgi:polysaccharide export outer membrane protein